MSQHPSLRISDKDKQQKSVLKRHERVKLLKDKEKWEEGSSVYGLPKVKITRFKIKKEKAVAAEGAVPGAEGVVLAPGAAPAKPGAKETGKAPAAEAKKEAKKALARQCSSPRGKESS